MKKSIKNLQLILESLKFFFIKSERPSVYMFRQLPSIVRNSGPYMQNDYDDFEILHANFNSFVKYCCKVPNKQFKNVIWIQCL